MKNNKFRKSLVQQLAEFGDRLVQDIKDIPEGGITDASIEEYYIWPDAVGLEGRSSIVSSLLETLSDAVIWIDRTGAIRGANQATEILFAQPRVEITGKSFLDLVHPDDRERLFNLWSTSLKNRSQPFQIRLRSDDDSYFDASAQAIPLIDANTFQGTLLIIRNLSQQVSLELTLKQSREQHRELLDKYPEAVILFDSKGIIQYINPSAQKLWNQPPNQIIGQTIIDKLSQDDWKRIENLASQDTNDTVKTTLVNLGADAQETFGPFLIERDYLEGTNVFRAIQETNPFPAHQKTHEISEEITILPSEIPSDKIRKILYEIKEIFYFASADGTIIYVNPVVESVLGYTPDDMLKMKVDEKIQDPKDRTRFFKLLQLHGWVKDFRYASENKAGEICYLSETASIITDNDDQIIGYYGIIRDRTADHHIEKALKDSESNYRILVEQLPQALILMDFEGHILHANKLGIQFLNITNFQSIKGERIYELCLPENNELLRNIFPKITPDKSITEQWQWTDQQKNRHYWNMTFSPVTINNDIQRIIWICTDIDRETRLQNHLRLGQKMETAAALISGLAHDFNNQLGVILGNSSLIKDQISPDHEFFQELSAIETSALNAKETMDQLTSLTTWGSGEHHNISVNQLVEKTVEFLRHTFPKNINVLTDLMANPDTILGDSQALRQALLNVCVNSRDAMPNGGNITITTDNVTNESFACGLGNDRMIHITVTDNGEGFDEAISNRIFEPFFTAKRDSGHSGLGMSTTFAIIQKHKGLIEVNSRKDDGTKIDIFLPEAETSHSILKTDDFGQETINLNTENQTILVVDDESSVRNMLHRIFEREGCSILEAEDGLKALETLKQHAQEINLIILDMIMPHMNGKDTFTNIRELYPDIPVLLSSGYPLSHEIQELTKFDHTYFIHKPYRRAAILLIAKQILSKKVDTSTQ